MVAAEVVVGLVVVMATALVTVVGYLYRDMKKRDRRRRKEIQGLNIKMSDMESSLYGHERGDPGFIKNQREQTDEICEKIDDMREQMATEHVETKALLSSILAWIEEHDDNADIDYDSIVDFGDR